VYSATGDTRRTGRKVIVISTDPFIDNLIDRGAPILICVSGGKDSRLAAEAATAYARSRNHTGEIKLVYSDLGRVVWSDAQEQCRGLANRLGLELVIVRREAGGLMERWQKRWADNVTRYRELSCVKVILPWSTPSMRFCTSELKTSIIQRWIRKTYQEPVICVLGIRRDEGRSKKSGRGAAPVIKIHDDAAKKMPAGSVDWNAIVDVPTVKVFQIHRATSIPLSDAYEVFKASRYSCCFCIMSSGPDLTAATRDPRNHDLYREQSELEIASTFSFQDGQWLSDIAPDLLTGEQRERLPQAKLRAKQREQIEALIPQHLLYVKGWPTVMPTPDEAELIAEVRREVSRVMEIEVKYTSAEEVTARYAELMAQNEAKKAGKKPRARATGSAPAKSSNRGDAARRAWETRRAKSLTLQRVSV
jgi:3'-phosphoadenosine 5'-phosphosulfate sulfotransferase (PAPS reductase)/FAD synthetase